MRLLNERLRGSYNSPPHSGWPQSQSISIVWPALSHDALQYFPSAGGEQLQAGFLQVSLSSAMSSS